MSANPRTEPSTRGASLRKALLRRRAGGPSSSSNAAGRRASGRGRRERFADTPYYPGEVPFAPDLFAVLDVDPSPRTRFIVQHEGRGLDLALEVLVHGEVAKDLDANLRRYAALGIRESFVFDRPSLRVFGWKLAAPGVRTYAPLLAQGGWLRSEVLDADLGVDGHRLRFRVGDAELLNADEELLALEDRLNDAYVERDELQENAEALRLRADAEAQRAEAEAQRADAAAREIAALRAELDRLRGR